LAAFVNLVSLSEGTEMIMPLRDAVLSEASRSLFRRVLAANGDALAVLDAPQRRLHPRNVEMADEKTYLVQARKIREAGTLLLARTALQVEDSQPNSAVATIEHLSGLAHYLASTPVASSQLAAVRLTIQTCRAAEHLLSRCRLTDDQLARLQRCFDPEVVSAGLKRALVAEQCGIVELFESRPAFLARLFVEDESSKQDEQSQMTPSDYETVARNYDVFLESMTALVRAAELPDPEAVRSARVVRARVAAERTFLLAQRWLAWSIESATTRFPEARALVKATGCAIAVQRFSDASKSAMPATLGSVAQAVRPGALQDPFAPSPLQYRAVTGGFIVYSVGADGNDDGGIEGLPGATTRIGTDLVFKVLWPFSGKR
jgi:hypothetical protein